MPQNSPDTPRIDAHHHLWKIGRFPYPWIEPGSVLDHDFGPEDLAPALKRHSLAQSVLVQTIPSLDETRWFLQLPKEHPSIAAVVGWVDLTDPAVSRVLKDLVDSYGRRLVGIRHNLHDEPDDRWILREDVLGGLAAVEAQGLAYDLLIRPRHLPAVLELIRYRPNLRMVIDHAAKPAIAERRFDDWAGPIAQAALHPQLFCKLSGLITEADPTHWQPADLKPYIDHVVEVFGPARVMFGSDWPVCLLAGSYDQVVEAFERNIDQLTAAEQAQSFGGSAAAFYRLHRE